ncbi:MAG: aminoglycoside phosphotransferase family protein [bacterium]
MDKFKADIKKEEVVNLLEGIYGEGISKIVEADSGKVKRVYFFEYMNEHLVLRLSEDSLEFQIEEFIQNKIKDKNFPLPVIYHIGKYNNFFYSINKKVEGRPIHQISEKEFINTLPAILKTMSQFHFLDISDNKGYGWPDNKLNASFNSFEEFTEANFSNELEGFWLGWHSLFEDSFMNYDIYMRLYNLMEKLIPYCEGKRYLAHTDFHYDHILVDANEVTGIIDWGRVRYLDFLFDVVTLVMQFPLLNLIPIFKNYYENNNIKVDNFDERFICAAIFQSLDGMRFWAKMGHEDSYNSILSTLLDFLKRNFNISFSKMYFPGGV